ncbi:unnamed protein product [Leptidea sinapis]|uniref:Uncharacterized protein n=1 Tax=Leptidea sinapis TaxID=189913 RepID=A0A5E4Q9M4_9NEOP|nr:unnamed protein product [Leptidea sinapis]
MTASSGLRAAAPRDTFTARPPPPPRPRGPLAPGPRPPRAHYIPPHVLNVSRGRVLVNTLSANIECNVTVGVPRGINGLSPPRRDSKAISHYNN